MTVPPSPRSFTLSVTDSKNVKTQSFMKTIVNWCSSEWRGMLAEFIAMMFLMIFGCMSCIPIDGFKVPPPLNGPLGFGLTVMVNIQIFGHLSGAYMNPFVSMIAWIFGKISFHVMVAYVIIECVAAILGYGILINLSSYDLVEPAICTTLPHRNLTAYQALGIEIVLTALLSLINCALWDPVYSKSQDSAALKFGLTVTVLSIAGGPLTGAGMNPARSLGPAVWTGRWDHHWVYWVGPLVGGILPAVFYKYVWLKKPQIISTEPDQMKSDGVHNY